jgi:hypothetical protein
MEQDSMAGFINPILEKLLVNPILQGFVVIKGGGIAGSGNPANARPDTSPPVYIMQRANLKESGDKH